MYIIKIINTNMIKTKPTLAVNQYATKEQLEILENKLEEKLRSYVMNNKFLIFKEEIIEQFNSVSKMTLELMKDDISMAMEYVRGKINTLDNKVDRSEFETRVGRLETVIPT